MDQIRLIAVTALLSILIWIVADNFLTDTAALQVSIRPYAPTGTDMTVEPLDAANEPFEVLVSGKKAVIALLKSRQPISVRVPVSNRPSGDHDLELLTALKASPEELADVFIQEVRPSTMRIRVDRDREEIMPVQIQPGALEFDGPIVVDPAEVKVTISELDYAQLDPADRRVILEPDPHLRNSPAGVLMSKAIPLRAVVGGYSVELDPNYVTVRFKLSEQLEEETLSAVPIKIEASLDIFNDFRVEVREPGAILTQPITIRGAAEIIERIRADEIRIRGVITLTASDKADPGQYRYLTPRFNLPEGVSLVSETEPIEFRLVPLPAPTDAAP